MGRKAIDVLKDIADQLGWVQPTTLENEELLDKDDRKLIRAFKRVLRVLSGIDDWRQLRSDGEIMLVAKYDTGTVDLTNGSATVSGTSTVWTTNMVGRAFIVDSHPVVYRIASVASATSLTLDRTYVGDTDTLVEYQICQDRYDLPLDFDRPIDEDWTRYDDSSTAWIRVVPPKEVSVRRRNRPADSTGDPDVVTLYMNDDAGEHRLAIFDTYPDSARLVRFQYQRLHPEIESDSQRILFDQDDEEMIQSGVEYLLLRGPEDDARAGMMLGEHLREQMNAVSKTELGQQRTRLTASQERAIQQRAKWGRRGFRIDWKSYFDKANFHDLP